MADSSSSPKSTSESSEEGWAVKVFNVDGTVREWKQQNEPTLTELQVMVGGFIEPLGNDQNAHEGHALYCNEEAIPLGLPLNRAWEIFRSCGIPQEDSSDKAAQYRRSIIPPVYGQVVFIRPCQ